MGYSTYQVQRLITRLKRAREAFVPVQRGGDARSPSGQSGFDRVLLSARAREQAAETADSIRLPAGTPPSTATIVDSSPLPFASRIELERRAGSFMRPPQKPTPSPMPIPKMRHSHPADSESTDASLDTFDSSNPAEQPGSHSTESD